MTGLEEIFGNDHGKHMQGLEPRRKVFSRKKNPMMKWPRQECPPPAEKKATTVELDPS